MLEVTQLSAWYGDAQALFEVSLHVRVGELVVLQGLNGAGKSTLLQSLMGLGPRVQGSITFQGMKLGTLQPHQRARAGLGYVPEDRRLFADLTVQENLTVALPRKQQPDALEKAFAMFPALKDLRHRRAAQTSGGEQQMLSIARTLMTGPSMLLLDEPCEGIAPALVESIRDALLSLKNQGLPMLVAEQNSLLSDHADRVITLVAGHISRPFPEHNPT